MKYYIKLDHIKLLVDIRYRNSTDVFNRLLQKEMQLRTSLAKLDQYRIESRHSNDYQQKAIGVDIIWQSWIGKKKEEINHQLAQVLAKKELCREQVKLAYGKVLVTQELSEQYVAQAQKRKNQVQICNAISQSDN